MVALTLTAAPSTTARRLQQTQAPSSSSTRLAALAPLLPPTSLRLSSSPVPSATLMSSEAFDAIGPDAMHAALAAHGASRLSPTLSPVSRVERWRTERSLDLLEERFLADERAQISARAAQAPTTAAGLVQWFENLRYVGPGQADTLFTWLAEEATLDEMRWFLRQEVAGEAGFEDLVAFAQLKLPQRAKLELARNYWDELGRGKAAGMHGPMLERLAQQLDLDSVGDDVVWESLALGNLMVGLALDRGYAFHLIGALGVVELTAPDRAEAVNAGLSRLGIEGHARQYYALHATLDKKHWAAWRDEALLPLVQEDPRRATALAEGALMRLTAGARCFSRYRTHLGVGR